MNTSNSANEPLFSVVIPVYNDESTIENAVQSVIAQSCQDLEIVVVDDCSADSTLEKLKKYENQIKLIKNSHNLGGARTRNVGTESALGRYIAYLDADDQFHETKLAEVSGQLRGTGAELLYSYAHDDFGNTVGRKHKSNFEIELLSGECDIVSSSSLVASRDLVNKVGGFDEKFPRKQDVEFVIRCANFAEVVCIEKPLFFKKNTGSPRYSDVKEAIDMLIKKFETTTQTMASIDRKKMLAFNQIRLAELSLSELNMAFIAHLAKAVFYDWKVVFKRLGRYAKKMRLKLRQQS